MNIDRFYFDEEKHLHQIIKSEDIGTAVVSMLFIQIWYMADKNFYLHLMENWILIFNDTISYSPTYSLSSRGEKTDRIHECNWKGKMQNVSLAF